MSGKCYCCARTDHTSCDKEKCPAYGKNCSYCGQKNHFETGCQDKFLGLERGRGLRAEEPRVSHSSSSRSAQAPMTRSYLPLPRAPAPPPRGIRSARVEEIPDDESAMQAAAQLDTMVANMAALQAQIADLKAKGF